MKINVTEMGLTDYEEALALWRETDGIGLSDADSREGIRAFLDRNPGLSLVVRNEENLIGTVLCGHDGRRGYLHHLTVAPDHRGQGIGSKLVTACLEKLESIGIQKCHIFLRSNNQDGEQFWRKVGWSERTDLKVMSMTVPGPARSRTSPGHSDHPPNRDRQRN